MKIIVLGCGLVGGPMAADLAKDNSYSVTVADINGPALEKIKQELRVDTIRTDLREKSQLQKLVAGYDMVVSAVPGFMGFETLKTIIEAGKNVVDIAFFPEDPFQLDPPAKAKGVAALVDCGVSPGMTSMLVGYAYHMLDEVDDALVYVGGLPQVREWPFEYRAVFSPVDVIEEYTRPARYIENGQLIVRPALSDPELIFFPGVGTLEAFNSDGLRTMLQTIKAANMKEKTLRYPGHIEKMTLLRETGFFSKDEIVVNGVRVRPLDVTAALMFPQWKLQEGEGDLTILQVKVVGKRDGRTCGFQYDMLDRYDAATRTISMARTTGYTATAAVRMLNAGLYKSAGITAPEMLGKHPECVQFLLEDLSKRGVVYRETRL